MNLLLWALLASVAAGLIVFQFFPRVLLNAGRGALRRRGGLVQKSVRVGELDWPYLEGGNSAGKVVVLVHGFGGDKDNWSFYAPYLKDQYRLICPDLPGFGENTRRLDLDYAVSVQAGRLREFLDALGIDRCHLGGNSMGGHIALQFALDHPARLNSLTLFNNAGVLGSNASELQTIVEADPQASPLVPRSTEDAKQLLGFVVYKQRYVPRQFVRLFFEDFKPHLPLLDRIFGQLLETMLNSPLNSRMGEVTVPTQIIWGRNDRLIDVSCATAQHDGIANSELVILEETGHVPMIERPATTARHHLAFLAKH